MRNVLWGAETVRAELLAGVHDRGAERLPEVLLPRRSRRLRPRGWLRRTLEQLRPGIGDVRSATLRCLEGVLKHVRVRLQEQALVSIDPICSWGVPMPAEFLRLGAEFRGLQEA